MSNEQQNQINSNTRHENNIQSVATLSVTFINVEELNRIQKENNDMKKQVDELKREKEILYNEMINKHEKVCKAKN